MIRLAIDRPRPVRLAELRWRMRHLQLFNTFGRPAGVNRFTWEKKVADQNRGVHQRDEMRARAAGQRD